MYSAGISFYASNVRTKSLFAYTFKQFADSFSITGREFPYNFISIISNKRNVDRLYVEILLDIPVPLQSLFEREYFEYIYLTFGQIDDDEFVIHKNDKFSLSQMNLLRTVFSPDEFQFDNSYLAVNGYADKNIPFDDEEPNEEPEVQHNEEKYQECQKDILVCVPTIRLRKKTHAYLTDASVILCLRHIFCISVRFEKTKTNSHLDPPTIQEIISTWNQVFRIFTEKFELWKLIYLGIR